MMSMAEPTKFTPRASARCSFRCTSRPSHRTTPTLVFRYVFFFFQAEDGIRDHCVTGVQTCALPILAKVARILFNTNYYELGEVKYAKGQHYPPTPETRTRVLAGDAEEIQVDMDPKDEIGRASCRERV